MNFDGIWSGLVVTFILVIILAVLFGAVAETGFYFLFNHLSFSLHWK